MDFRLGGLGQRIKLGRLLLLAFIAGQEQVKVLIGSQVHRLLPQLPVHAGDNVLIPCKVRFRLATGVHVSPERIRCGHHCCAHVAVAVAVIDVAVIGASPCDDGNTRKAVGNLKLPLSLDFDVFRGLIVNPQITVAEKVHHLDLNKQRVAIRVDGFKVEAGPGATTRNADVIVKRLQVGPALLQRRLMGNRRLHPLALLNPLIRLERHFNAAGLGVVEFKARRVWRQAKKRWHHGRCDVLAPQVQPLGFGCDLDGLSCHARLALLKCGNSNKAWAQWQETNSSRSGLSRSNLRTGTAQLQWLA